MQYADKSAIRTELKRKTLHISMVGFAFLVRYLSWWGAAICALSAFLFNKYVLPRIGGKGLFRPGDAAKGYPPGILLYALSLAVLFLIFPKHPHLVCGAWALMALGDGFATLSGMLFGKHKLPWNPSKSWEGALVFWVFGTAGCAFFIWWAGKGHGFETSFALLVTASLYAALFCAILETIPTKVDDNITVPFAGTICLYCLLGTQFVYTQTEADFLKSNILPAVIINLIVVTAAFLFRTVSISGAVSGFFIGSLVYVMTGYWGYSVLILFFILASGSTKIGYAKKHKAGIAQEMGGKRGWRHALANCGVAVLLAPFVLLGTAEYSAAFAVAFCASLATAVFDTVSSEIGQLIGKRTFLIPSMKRVPPGTEGAVSVEGTLAGLLAALILATTGFALSFLSLKGIIAVTAGALVGTTFESLVGSKIETHSSVENEFLNFANTVIGAASAFAVFMLIY